LAWLNVVYKHAFAEPYAAVDDGTEIPSGGSSSSGNSSSSNTVAELCKLLAFADAVGSTRGIIIACLASFSVGGMTLTLQLAEQTSQLRMNKALYYLERRNPSVAGSQVYLLADKSSVTSTLLNDQQLTLLHEQLAAQLEQLLYLAHKLQLPALQQHALRFIHAHTTPAFKQSKQIPLLTAEQLRHWVFSDRVAAAAGAASGSSAVVQQQGSAAAAAAACTAGRDAWVSSQLQQHFRITSGAAAQQPSEQGTVDLKVVGQQQQLASLKVELQQDFLEYMEGEVVDLELRLPGSAVVSSMTLKGGGRCTNYDVTLCISAK
jgi:hypothetical protein